MSLALAQPGGVMADYGSPTDTAPLSRAAKILTMTQSVISLIAIVVVAGTAINILAGGA